MGSVRGRYEDAERGKVIELLIMYMIIGYIFACMKTDSGGQNSRMVRNNEVSFLPLPGSYKITLWSGNGLNYEHFTLCSLTLCHSGVGSESSDAREQLMGV